LINYKKIWFNPARKEGADSTLYGDGGFYETANSRRQAYNVLRGVDELRYLDRVLSGTVLDYGSGEGDLAEMLDGKGYDPIKQPQMPKGLFDTVFCVHVIEHVKDHIKLIQDMKSKLSHNGLLIIVCHNVVGWPNKRAREPWHRWLFGKDIVQIIEAEGFKLKARLTWGGCTSRIRWIKEPINRLRKKLGIGDVQMVIMERI
jgi:SAM-dependent methyltransferase